MPFVPEGRRSRRLPGAIRAERAKASGAIKFGSRAAVLRRSEGTRFSSPNDDEVGGCQARSARSEPKRAEQSNMDVNA
jgi:hypothetical protein